MDGFERPFAEWRSRFSLAEGTLQALRKDLLESTRISRPYEYVVLPLAPHSVPSIELSKRRQRKRGLKRFNRLRWAKRGWEEQPHRYSALFAGYIGARLGPGDP